MRLQSDVILEEVINALQLMLEADPDHEESYKRDMEEAEEVLVKAKKYLGLEEA